MPKPPGPDLCGPKANGVSCHLGSNCSAVLLQILAALEQHDSAFQELKYEFDTSKTVVQDNHVVLMQKLEKMALGVAFASGFVDAEADVTGTQSAVGLAMSSPQSVDSKSVEKKKRASTLTLELAPQFSANWKTSSNSSDRSPPFLLGLLHSWLSRVVLSVQFEVVMCLVIIANSFAIAARLQLQGLHEAYELGLRPDDADWGSHVSRFEVVEYVFNTVYLVELVSRISVRGRHFFMNWVGCIDAMVVIVACLDTYWFQPRNVRVLDMSVLRLVRLSQIFRIAKFLVYSQHMQELRVLLRTIRLGMRAIVWSVVLLGGIIVTGGILMTQLALLYVRETNIPFERRKWLLNSFGTTAASIYTMFECTFTGGWRFYSRPLIEDVSYHFAFFWVSWIIFVNFMTMRIVGALFLKQLMEVANVDAERLAMSNMKRRDKFAVVLRELFQAVDTSGDGAISEEEFALMLQDKDVVKSFSKLDLGLDEVVALFTVLSDDDGSADYEEFLNGALKMNSSARTIDAVQVMHNQLTMHRDIGQILEVLQPLKRLFKLD